MLERILKIHQIKNKVTKIGRRPITKEKSNVLLNRVKPFSSKIIIAANKSFKRENKKVEAIKGDTQKRISNAGKNIYVKNGINKIFVKIVIQEN